MAYRASPSSSFLALMYVRSPHANTGCPKISRSTVRFGRLSVRRIMRARRKKQTPRSRSVFPDRFSFWVCGDRRNVRCQQSRWASSMTGPMSVEGFLTDRRAELCSRDGSPQIHLQHLIGNVPSCHEQRKSQSEQRVGRPERRTSPLNQATCSASAVASTIMALSPP